VSTLVFTLDEANRAYDELRELNVQLDADPLAYGPKRLNAKVSEVRRMLERCERLFLDISQRLHSVKHARRIAETNLDLAKKDLIANDPHVRAGRSIVDREAIVTGRLIKEVHEVQELNSTEEGLVAVLTVIKAKRTDLKDTEGRLRDQMRLCGEEMGLGNRWGSKMPHTPDVDLKNAPVVNIAPVDDILSGIDGEIHLRQQTGDWNGPGQEEAAQAVATLVGTVIEEDEVDVIVTSESEEDDDGVDQIFYVTHPEITAPPETPAPSLDQVLGLEAPVTPVAALVGSSTSDEVESFFGDPEAIAAVVASKKSTAVPALDDSALNDLLSSFEEI
jgi:hypothetical protein